MKLDKNTTECLLHSKVIERRIEILAFDIYEKYKDIELPLVCAVVLDGAFMFAADLLRQLGRYGLDVDVRFIKASSYHGLTKSSGRVGLDMSSIHSCQLYSTDKEVGYSNRDVLIIEDIVDTGLTYKAICKQFNQLLFNNVSYCTFLWKETDRCEIDIDTDNFMYGFKIKDEFVVGYGLDYLNRYRQLDALCLFNQSE